MKILWVKAGGLIPPDTGGKIRSYQLLRRLAAKHGVTLFTFYAAHPHDAHDQLEREDIRVLRHPLQTPAPRSLAEVGLYARQLFSLQPYSITKYCRSEVALRLRQLLQEDKYDLILCDFLCAAGVIPWDLACPKVLFTHNVEALIWQRHFRVARNPVWKAVCWREYKTMARAEHHYLGLADHILTVSDTDRDHFTQFIDSSRVTVIPTGVDVNYYGPTSEPVEPNALVFTGAMDWMPNEDGMFHFLEKILPRIRRQIPEVTLWIVGRQPSRRLRELAARTPGVCVTGTVEDIRPYVHRAAVYVVPLLVGSGTRLKIFEAMAMGKAVVSTPLGAEGLPIRDGENVMLADEPESFANAVVRLLQSSELRNNLGRAAREFVEQKYSWVSVAAELEAVLTTVARRYSETRAEVSSFQRLANAQRN